MTTNVNRLLLYNASDKNHTIMDDIYMRRRGTFLLKDILFFINVQIRFVKKSLSFILFNFDGCESEWLRKSHT